MNECTRDSLVCGHFFDAKEFVYQPKRIEIVSLLDFDSKQVWFVTISAIMLPIVFADTYKTCNK